MANEYNIKIYASNCSSGEWLILVMFFLVREDLVLAGRDGQRASIPLEISRQIPGV